MLIFFLENRALFIVNVTATVKKVQKRLPDSTFLSLGVPHSSAPLWFLGLTLAAHRNPRLSEAESGVFPILQDPRKQAIRAEQRRDLKMWGGAAQRWGIPGSDPSPVIGWSVRSVNPRRTPQNVHSLWSGKTSGSPLPNIPHHVIQTCRGWTQR